MGFSTSTESLEPNALLSSLNKKNHCMDPVKDMIILHTYIHTKQNLKENVVVNNKKRKEKIYEEENYIYIYIFSDY